MSIDFRERLRSAVVLPDRRPTKLWAHENVNFGNAEAFKGKYDVENVPWTYRILEAWDDPKVREITSVMPPQESGKTKAAEVCLCRRIATQPAKMAFNAKTNVKAHNWQETRWEQMMTACPLAKAQLSANRYKNKKGRIVFRNGTFLLINGAETDANRQSDSVEVQVNDEVHLWEKPWLAEMHARTRAYRDTKKILNISIGGDENSELHERFLAGTQEEWCHHCPKCDQMFSYVHDPRRKDCNIRYDLTKVILHGDGRLDLRAFDETVHVVCQSCGHEMRYDEDRLIAMNLDSYRRGDGYVPKNPDADPSIVSLHVNAFAIGARRWSQILEPWVRIHVRGGLFNAEVARTFIVEDLAEFHSQKPIIVPKEIRLGAYRRGEVLKPGDWKEEWIRVMTVDNQRGSQGDIPHRWYTCRAFARDGRSRLVDCGRLNEWSEVRARQLELGVPDPTPERPGPWVVVDRRHNPTEVDEICAEYHWYGLFGTDSDEFPHGENSPFFGKRVLFSEPRQIDIGFGTKEQGRKHAVYFLFSDQRTEDILAPLRAGKAEQWEVPADIGDWCPEYAVHINAHQQQMKRDRKGQDRLTWVKISGHPDHLYDCEKMAVVIGLMAGVFRRD